MERRLAVHARAYRKALTALVATVVFAPAASAIAAPHAVDAKAAFERGVAAYTAGDYAGASEALGRSFALEPDVETLFAWAQTERKLDRCDTAIGLYEKLLTYDLPAENKAAIEVSLGECRDQVAQPARPSLPVAAPPAATATATVDVSSATETPNSKPRARWKDPVGLGLVSAGVVGLSVGTVFLVQASSANSDKDRAPTYGEFVRLEQRAEDRGKLGVIAATTGGVLIGAGIVWFATRGHDERATQVSGWMTADGGGVVAVGRF